MMKLSRLSRSSLQGAKRRSNPLTLPSPARGAGLARRQLDCFTSLAMMTERSDRRRSYLSAMRCGFFALALTLCACLAARADPIADFYRGRSISWILSAGAGGVYASYAQAFAPYFAAHIPGNPTIVIQNMPGGGGIRAMLYLNAVAPKDGTTLGLVHSSVPFAPLYGIKAANFDPRRMNWIGSIDASTGICVAWHTSGIASWADMLRKPFTVGSTGAGSQMETMPIMLDNLFGTKIKVIAGYTGGNDIYLAMERGEVQGRCGGLISSIRSTRPDWFPDKKVNV